MYDSGIPNQNNIDKAIFDSYFSRLNAVLESVSERHRVAYLEGILRSAMDDRKVTLPVYMALSFYVQFWLVRFPPS